MQQNKIKLTREEQAKLEVGHTEISRPLAFVLLFAFLFTIYSVPVMQQMLDQRKAASMTPGRSTGKSELGPVKAASLITWQSLMSINAGMLRRINLYQDHLDDTIFLTKALNPVLQSIMTGWLKGGNEQAYCGKGEWLFYRPDVEYLTGRGFLDPKVMAERARAGGEWSSPPQPDPVKALELFRDQLALRDIELIVMPIPSKPMIYPEKYSDRFEGRDDVLQNASFSDFRRRLDKARISCFDPAPLLQKSRDGDNELLYLKCDTHWSPLGMKLVAGALAGHIRAMKIMTDPPLVQYRQVAMNIENLGDIASMLKLPPDQDYYHKESVSIDRIFQPDGRPWQSDPNADILFLGDSFSNIYSLEGMGWGANAGLVETLSAQLGRPIDRITINDNGSYATRRVLSRDARKGIDHLAGKRLVIYEFAARELSKGDWKTDLDLSPVPDAVQVSESVKTVKPDAAVQISGDVLAEGRIADITKVPSPGSVPYKDCIMAIHLVDLKATKGELNGSEALVYAWGMRDNQWTAYAELNPGMKLSLRLTPWANVETQYGSYNRQELDNDNLLFLDTYWLVSDESDGDINNTSAESVEAAPPLASKTSVDNVNANENTSGQDQVKVFRDELSRIADKMDASQQNVWTGREGWLFFGPELRSLTVGQFWGERAVETSKALNSKYADPLPAIVDFNEQLKKVGIELWLMPVPQKASIYQSMVDDKLANISSDPAIRYDGEEKKFYDLLQAQGVQVVDLYPMYRSQSSEGDPLYCRQDTHWSGRAISLASRELASRIKKLQWYNDVPKLQYMTVQREVEITGDLWKYLGNESQAKERIPLTFVTGPGGDDEGVSDWRESPVLLLGDSHNLVFHVGQELFARGAGLPDLLACDLGFAVDLVAVRGSGATPARINLLRRGDNLKGKRLVIWCFTAREFTETTDGWRNVPVIR